MQRLGRLGRLPPTSTSPEATDDQHPSQNGPLHRPPSTRPLQHTSQAALLSLRGSEGARETASVGGNATDCANGRNRREGAQKASEVAWRDRGRQPMTTLTTEPPR